MRRGILATTLGLVALLVGWEAQAEIRVVTDRNGEYRETRILMPETMAFGAGSSNVWTPVGRSSKSSTLNPDGASTGDLWPTIADNDKSHFRSWVIWSRLNDLDYDLAWSRWTDAGWQEITWLTPGADQLGDDLDASMTLDSSGRPYVVWWRDEGGQGRVYLSLFLLTQWMNAYPVSESDVDGRYPSIEILNDGTIEVTYETPGGVAVQEVVFDEPVTITDDIDPLDHLNSDQVYYVEDATP